MDAPDDVDRDGMLDAVLGLPDQLEAALDQTAGFEHPFPFRLRHVVVAGMGGSALAGEYAAAWANETGTLPPTVLREYALPPWVREDALVLAVSYSGNTEETLSLVQQARERGAALAAITSGGRLRELAEDAGAPVLDVPGGFQPRAALGHLMVRAARVLEALELVEAEEGVREAAKITRGLAEELGPGVPADGNQAKQLAEAVAGRVPVVYGSGLLAPAARRFAGELNENGKTLAFHGALPEMNHNEIVGWGSVEDPERFTAILLRDPHEHPQVEARFGIVRDLLEDRGVPVHEVEAQGGSPAARLLSATLVGDATSVYLAVHRGLDPTPVPPIEDLKARLAETGFRADLLDG